MNWDRKTYIDGGDFDSDELFLMITYTPWEGTGWTFEVVGRSAMENQCKPIDGYHEGPPFYFVPLAAITSAHGEVWKAAKYREAQP